MKHQGAINESKTKKESYNSKKKQLIYGELSHKSQTSTVKKSVGVLDWVNVLPYFNHKNCDHKIWTLICSFIPLFGSATCKVGLKGNPQAPAVVMLIQDSKVILKA